MAVDAKRLPVESLARVATLLASGVGLGRALEELAAAVVEATGADAGVVRVVDPADSMLVARSVAPADSALAAGLVGSRVPTAPPNGADGGRSSFAGVHVAPAEVGGHVVGAIELLRVHGPFDAQDEALASLAAAQLALALRTSAADAASGGRDGALRLLEVAGEALAAGGDRGGRRSMPCGSPASRRARPAPRSGGRRRTAASRSSPSAATRPTARSTAPTRRRGARWRRGAR